MSRVKYLISRNGPLKQKDAKVIGVALQQAFPDGKFKPKDVVDIARPKKSPLHKYFDWNDTSAAEKWRIHQARIIISSIEVSIVGSSCPPVRKWIHVSLGKNKTSYVDSNTAMKTPELWNQVIQKALDEVIYWRDKYEQYKELSPIVRAINETERKLSHGKPKKIPTRRSKSTGRNSRRRLPVLQNNPGRRQPAARA